MTANPDPWYKGYAGRPLGYTTPKGSAHVQNNPVSLSPDARKNAVVRYLRAHLSARFPYNPVAADRREGIESTFPISSADDVAPVVAEGIRLFNEGAASVHVMVYMSIATPGGMSEQSNFVLRLADTTRDHNWIEGTEHCLTSWHLWDTGEEEHPDKKKAREAAERDGLEIVRKADMGGGVPAVQWLTNVMGNMINRDLVPAERAEETAANLFGGAVQMMLHTGKPAGECLAEIVAGFTEHREAFRLAGELVDVDIAGGILGADGRENAINTLMQEAEEIAATRGVALISAVSDRHLEISPLNPRALPPA